MNKTLMKKHSCLRPTPFGRLFFLILVIACASLSGVSPALAAETGKLVEKDGNYVFVESMDPSLRLLLERSIQNGIITQDEYNKVVEESETRTNLLSPSFKGWYDRGFNLSFNDNAFFMEIGSVPKCAIRNGIAMMRGGTQEMPKTFQNYSAYSAITGPIDRKTTGPRSM